MISSGTYNIEIEPNTRDHKGYFVQEAIYQLMEIDKAGWALICQDNATCHYVDPANLREIAALLSD